MTTQDLWHASALVCQVLHTFRTQFHLKHLNNNIYQYESATDMMKLQRFKNDDIQLTHFQRVSNMIRSYGVREASHNRAVAGAPHAGHHADHSPILLT